MLTPTDIHLIVGVFSKLTTPDNVDIILGEMVYDKASKRKRDIDITIKYKNEFDEEIAYVGLQVKDHSRKLGSPEVEQLCLHIKDSESINKGGIISASGYTRPAINKAAFHNIDLYEFKDWDYTSKELPHLRFAEGFKFKEVRNTFVSIPDISYLMNEQISESEHSDFNQDSLVFNIDCTPIPNTKTIRDLNNNFINQAIQHDEIKNKLDNANINEETIINVTLNVENPPIVVLKGKRVPLNQVSIRGIMGKKEIITTPRFKILVKLNDPEYQVGGAICEISTGLLFGFVTSHNDKSVKLVSIPIADRLRKKIHEIKIK